MTPPPPAITRPNRHLERVAKSGAFSLVEGLDPVEAHDRVGELAGRCLQAVLGHAPFGQSSKNNNVTSSCSTLDPVAKSLR